jgi:hypothetical protein
MVLRQCIYKIRQGLQSRWMKNKVQPSTERLSEIAHIFGYGRERTPHTKLITNNRLLIF